MLPSRILIADSNVFLCNAIKDYLIDRYGEIWVNCITNGIKAYYMLANEKYDLLILDLDLTGIDGFGVLARLREKQVDLPPCIVITSDVVEDGRVQSACGLGADYFVFKPFDIEVFCKRLVELSGTAHSPLYNVSRHRAPSLPRESIDERIARLILQIGVPANISGFLYIKDAVKLVFGCPSMIHALTKQLYPAVAEQHSITANKVERSIRHAIESTWARGDFEAINRIFGCSLYTKYTKPTNGELIALMSDKLLSEDPSHAI